MFQIVRQARMSNPIMSYLGNSGKNISYNIFCFHLTRVMKPIQKHITHHKWIQNLKQTREHQSEQVHPLAQFQREFRTQKNSLNIWQCSDKTYNKLFKIISFRVKSKTVEMDRIIHMKLDSIFNFNVFSDFKIWRTI